MRKGKREAMEGSSSRWHCQVHATLILCPSGQGDLCLRTNPGEEGSELSPAPASPGPRHAPQHLLPTLLPWAACQTQHLHGDQQEAARQEVRGVGPQRSMGRRWHAVPSHLPEPGEPTPNRPPTGSTRIGLVRGV